ncbi:hypothetical protein DID88_004660 [Monilinia fructigena]|uniref:ACB domain-containing protein n=1 Tax=Monilinia fructigena TaxID=38457 RepID=A0A395IT52_9HELO|nr:hypothetical protein DID88_004660 [Monilinia fructigena]
MADSVDRVFVHALNTVKKISKTGASRPPPAERLRLYGLYKQAMEGDVDGVMMRPSSRGEEEGGEGERLQGEELKRERINGMLGMRRRGSYANTTADSRELVSELEFVWNQIKNNSPSSTGSSPGHRVTSYTMQSRQFLEPLLGTSSPMRVLSPMSQDDEAERESERRLGYNAEDEEEYTDGKNHETKWRRNVEQALVKMTAEIAALREQIATGREYQGKKSRSPRKWLAWFIWIAIKHMLVDMVLLGTILLWMRRKKDRRVEDLVREGLRIGREYMRKILPSR